MEWTGLVRQGCLNAGLDVVPREETCDAVHDAFVPAIVVLLHNIDNRVFGEGELVVLVSSIIIDGYNWKEKSNT